MHPTTISSLVWWMCLIKRSVFFGIRGRWREMLMVELYKCQWRVCRSRTSHLDHTSVLFPFLSLLSSTLFSSLFLPPSSSHIFFSLLLSFINPMWILHSPCFSIFAPFKSSSCGMKVFFPPCFLTLFPQISQGRKSLFLPLGRLSRAQDTRALIIYNLSDPLSPSSSDLFFFFFFFN